MVSLELEARLDNLLRTAQTEMANIDLFAPIEEREECPICLIPLPLIEDEISFYACCGKNICGGCIHKQIATNIKKGLLDFHEYKCAFCRQPESINLIKAIKKQMKKNNPDAFMAMAREYIAGKDVIRSDTKAIEMYIRAAELGRAEAFGAIGSHYERGILKQDNSKALEFYEVGAKKGSVQAHKDLAHFAVTVSMDIQKSNNHLKVAASAGDKEAMDNLMTAYKHEEISKEELTQILRVFQSSSNEMKSKDRDVYRLVEESRKKGEPLPAHLRVT